MSTFDSALCKVILHSWAVTYTHIILKHFLICWWNFINLGMAGVIPQEREMYTTVFEYFNSTAVFR